MDINEQIELDQLCIERDELYQELIDMAEAGDWDFEEIDAINSDIADIDDKILKLRRKYSSVLKRLYK